MTIAVDLGRKATKQTNKDLDDKKIWPDLHPNNLIPSGYFCDHFLEKLILKNTADTKSMQNFPECKELTKRTVLMDKHMKRCFALARVAFVIVKLIK